MGECELALPRFDAFGVDVLLVREPWERPFPGSSKLVIAGTEDLEPSSRSRYRMSIVYNNGKIVGGDLER